MRIAAALLSGLLLAVSPAAYAADVGLNLEDGKFSPDTVKMRLGDKLVVANRTSKNQWIWGQGGDWAFDYCDTRKTLGHTSPDSRSGRPEPRRPNYWRLPGPNLLIEYDNTQNDANHIHSVWHHPGRDFGADLLRRH